MDCNQYLELMSAALDGELTAEERRELDAHLAVCPECADLFETLSANARAARELDCEMPADLKARIMNNLPAREAAPKQGKVISWKRWAPVAAAACLVLVVSLMPRFGLDGKSGSSMAPSAAHEISVADSAKYEVADNGAKYGSNPAEAVPAPSSAPATIPSESPEEPAAPEPVQYWLDNQRSIHLPYLYENEASDRAVVIGSTESLDAYLEDLQSVSKQPLSDDLEQLRYQYSSEVSPDFFDTHRLLFVRVYGSSGGNRYQIAAQGLTRDSVVVEQIEFGATMDTSRWLIVAEVDAMFDDGDTLDVFIEKAYDRYYQFDHVMISRQSTNSSSTSTATVIRSWDALRQYLDTHVCHTDPATGEVIPGADLAALVSAYGSPIENWFFDGVPLVAFTVTAPVNDPEFEVLTIDSKAVTIRQDHYAQGDSAVSTWLFLVRVYDTGDILNLPTLEENTQLNVIVTNGYP